MSKLKDLLKDLKIDETNTKKTKKEKKFTKVKDMTYPKADYNFMADLLELPKTKKGNKYLLVVVDLWTDEFDIEPLKTKTAAVVLAAYKKMIKRPHIKLAHASIQVYGGGEFKGVFQKFMYDKSILKRTAMRGRHQQQSNVERLNRTLGRIFNGYMNNIEKKTNKSYKEWDLIIDQVRTKLNKIRKTEPKVNKFPNWELKDPKFKIGQHVLYKLGPSQAEDELGNIVHGKFRDGDRRWSKQVKKIKRVLSYMGDVPIRYMLMGLPNVSFAESELKKTRAKKSFKVKKIIVDDYEKKKKTKK